MVLMRVPVPDGRGRVSRQRRLGGVVATVAIVVVSALVAPAASAQMRAGLWLDVFVEDADGAPVTDLRRGDFVVDQGGALVRGIDAELVEWPLRLVILLEDSDRLAGYLAHLRNGHCQVHVEQAGSAPDEAMTHSSASDAGHLSPDTESLCS